MGGFTSTVLRCDVALENGDFVLCLHGGVNNDTTGAFRFSLALKRERIAKTKRALDFAVSLQRLLLQVWLCWQTFIFF